MSSVRMSCLLRATGSKDCGLTSERQAIARSSIRATEHARSNLYSATNSRTRRRIAWGRAEHELKGLFKRIRVARRVFSPTPAEPARSHPAIAQAPGVGRAPARG